MDKVKITELLRSCFPSDYTVDIVFCEQTVVNSYHFELTFGDGSMLSKGIIFDLDDKFSHSTFVYNFYLNSFHDKVLMDIFIKPRLL